MKMVLGMPTKSKRRKALEKLPTDLYDSFHGVITRIRECPNASQAELGMRVLVWLHFVCRSLKIEELQHALAVEKSDTEFDVGNIPPRKALLDCCLGLVIVDKETLTVRFVHYTLEEYFREFREKEFPSGCNYVAETCLTYLNFAELRQHCTDLESLRKIMQKYRFLRYAALYWGIHLKQQCNDALAELANKILDHESKRPPCAIQVLSLELQRYQPKRIARGFSGIHVMAYFGLSENMTNFCNIERDIAVGDESYRTPLLWAAERGHGSFVRLLIYRKDVDINARDGNGFTPLALAAERGHEAVVQLLVSRDGIDINAHDYIYRRTPLSWAAARGREAVVRLLVDRKDVHINTEDSTGARQTPLSLAAVFGHEAVVRLLNDRRRVRAMDTDIAPVCSRVGDATY